MKNEHILAKGYARFFISHLLFQVQSNKLCLKNDRNECNLCKISDQLLNKKRGIGKNIYKGCIHFYYNGTFIKSTAI